MAAESNTLMLVLREWLFAEVGRRNILKMHVPGDEYTYMQWDKWFAQARDKSKPLKLDARAE